MRQVLIVISAGLLLAATAHAGIDVNTATEADLDGLRGIGPATTRAILEQRAQRPYADWGDLLARVPGLGGKRAQALSEAGLTVDGATYTRPSRKRRAP